MTALEYLLELLEPAWKADAECRKRGIPLESFFPERGASMGAYGLVAPVCAACVVRSECLDDALRWEARYPSVVPQGFQGGMAPRDRARFGMRGAA